jgi:hypothetical protein
MSKELEVILVKKLEYQRIDCVCGVAVIPKDPSPDISEAVKDTVREFGAKFQMLDTTVHPEAVLKYHITKLPAVVIENKAYPAEVEVIRKVLNEMAKTG